ncbi:efflux RND transporter periplasmic adaptor subunit, partial [Pseudomonas frederiksbergensis]|nr:efflux RND transporter periplasmic adaptor subunit [Pseudomonas frederiksbergensis]
MSRPVSSVCLGVWLVLTGCGEQKTAEAELPRVGVQRVDPSDFAASVTLTG